MTSVNVALEQNFNSRIISSLKNVPYSSRYGDTMKENQPNNFPTSMLIENRNSFNGLTPSIGQKFDFYLPEDHFLRNLWIKTSFTTDNIDFDNTLIGIFLFSSIDLMQFGKRIAHNNPGYLKNRISDLPDTPQQNYQTVTTGIKSGSTFICYTPLFYWCLEHENDNILLDFHKDLRIHASWSGINMGNLTNVDIKLVCLRRCFQQDYISSYIASTYPRDKKHRNFMIYDTRVIKYDNGTVNQFPIPTNNVGPTSVYITLPVLASAFHICMLDVNNKTTNITRIKLYCGTNEIIDIDKYVNTINSIGLSGDPYNTGVIPADQQQNEFSYYLGNKNRQGFNAGIDLSVGPYRLDVYYDAPSSDTSLIINIEYISLMQSYNENGIFEGSLIH